MRSIGFGFIAFVALIASVFNWAIAPNVFGSYSSILTTTKANLTTQDAKLEEELWCRSILFGSDLLYQENPFADGMTGKPGSGKPVVRVNDTTKVHGSTINIPVYGGFGGPGVSGNGDRYAALQKARAGVFQVSIGRFFFGYGIDSVAKEETVIGSQWDQMISEAMTKQMAKKKSDDHLMRLKAAATVGGRNHMLPDGVTTVAGLRTTNVFSTSMLSSGNDRMTSLGGRPMSMGAADSGGSNVEEYLLLSPHPVLRPLDTESAYLDGRLYADVRGGNNGLFKGNYNSWNGVSIYRWKMKDHGNDGPVGSPLMPRAFLRTALTGADTASIVTGGGSTASVTADVTKNYFEFFTGAFYQYFNGNTIARETTNTKYLMIINNDGTGYAVYSYKVVGSSATLADQITIFARISIGVGTEVNDHPAGSLIVECNVAGVPYGYSLFLGGDVLVEGTGTINGDAADPMYGRRQQETKNLGMDHAIGIEAVWGNAVVERADGVKPGFILAQTAFPVAGAPVVP
jgi:hypothetical protein